MRKFYEKAELELKELLILDLTNSGEASAPDFMEDEENPDDGSFDVG